MKEKTKEKLVRIGVWINKKKTDENIRRIKIISKIINILIIILFIYYFIMGLIEIKNIIRAIIITIIFLIIKYLLDIFVEYEERFGVEKREEEREKRRKQQEKIFKIFKKEIFYRNPRIIRIIYYSLYYFPTNWFYLIIMWIGKKWWEIRLYVNSNKDIIGKKYFKRNWSGKYNPIIEKEKLWRNIRLYIIFPINKMTLLWTKIKIKLILKEYKKYIEMRIFGYTLITILIINNLHIVTILRNTEVINTKEKIILFSIIIYIYLVITSLDIKRLGTLFEKEFLIVLVLDTTIYKFHSRKDILLFMCIAKSYGEYINKNYNNYLNKNLYMKNIEGSEISTMVKIGKFENSVGDIIRQEKYYTNNPFENKITYWIQAYTINYYNEFFFDLIYKQKNQKWLDKFDNYISKTPLIDIGDIEFYEDRNWIKDKKETKELINEKYWELWNIKQEKEYYLNNEDYYIFQNVNQEKEKKNECYGFWIDYKWEPKYKVTSLNKMIWMYEKNYYFPLSILAILNKKWIIMSNLFSQKMVDLEIYKLFYGEEIINKYFSAEKLEEIYDIYFSTLLFYNLILCLNRKIFEFEAAGDDFIVKLKEEIIPSKRKTNKLYNEIIEILSFLDIINYDTEDEKLFLNLFPNLCEVNVEKYFKKGEDIMVIINQCNFFYKKERTQEEEKLDISNIRYFWQNYKSKPEEYYDEIIFFVNESIKEYYSKCKEINLTFEENFLLKFINQWEKKEWINREEVIKSKNAREFLEENIMGNNEEKLEKFIKVMKIYSDYYKEKYNYNKPQKIERTKEKEFFKKYKVKKQWEEWGEVKEEYKK